MERGISQLVKTFHTMSTLLFRLHSALVIVYLGFLLFFLFKKYRQSGAVGGSNAFGKAVKWNTIFSLSIILTGLLLALLVPVMHESWFHVKLGLAALFFLVLYGAMCHHKTAWVLGSLPLFFYVFTVTKTKNLLLQPESKLRQNQVALIEKQALDELALAKELYHSLCKRCHGKDGGAGIYEAKDLRQSALDNSLLGIWASREKSSIF